MASFFYQDYSLQHRVYQPSNAEEETYEYDPPPGFVEIDLTISVRRTYIRHDCLSRRFIDSDTAPFYSSVSEDSLCFDIDDLRDPKSLYHLLAPVLTGLGINPTSLANCNVFNEIVEPGFRIGYLTSDWGISSVPLVVEFLETVIVHIDNQEYSINSALSESALEFDEANNYGMELGVGFDAASRMPCSHTFHGNCIENWLKLSHYCPICRFEMPTSTECRAITALFAGS
ncbi:hypothetical protein PTKIN_Ptkin17bG0160500 [Pterospermum kingtungense]